MPSLAVAAGRGLKSNVKTLFDNGALYGLVEIEALTHAACGFEYFIGRKI
jgi:hypothetical protein